MSRVAIIGSCITRDLWAERGDALEGLAYVSRSSLPCLLAPPLAGFRPARTPPADLGPYQHRALVADLRKTALARLLAFRPTHLIFDFIDERYDLLSAGGTVVTHSWELEASGYLAQPAFRGARPVPRLGPGCERLWREAARELAALVQATPLREARPILHSARWAAQARGPDGAAMPLGEPEILPGRTASIEAHNALLARYEAHFLALFPDAAVVAAAEHRLADPGHRWGPSPFHYVPEYYAAIRAQLEALDVERFRPGLAAPSAPAA